MLAHFRQTVRPTNRPPTARLILSVLGHTVQSVTISVAADGGLSARPAVPTSTTPRLRTAATGGRDRLNTVCPYFTMFPLDFPLARLQRAKRSQWVLDPFCGRGTTLFAARMLGLPSVGIDSNPVAVAIAAAKVASVDVKAVENRTWEVLGNRVEPQHIPSGAFWDLCFHPETLLDICRFREYLAQMPASDETANLLRAIILGILHGPLRKGEPSYLSNQMPRTYATKPDAAVRYWRRNEMSPPHVDVGLTINRRVRYTLAQVPGAQPGDVYLGESSDVLRKLPHRFDWVITSPPYYRMYTYLPDQWLRNWFLGGPDAVDYSVAGQVSHSSEDNFVRDLATVWRAAAARCNPEARLAVRFGALPSIKSDSPESLLRRSLKEADAGWKVTRVKDAGQPAMKARQAVQMGNQAGSYAPEIDLQAILRPSAPCAVSSGS